jgi:hypothetical protein
VERIPGEVALIKFWFENLHADAPKLTAPHEFLLRIVADFSMWSDDQMLYEEPEFSVVEFAQQLDRWLGEPDLTDFEYDATDAEEPGLVWFRFERDGWRVGSLFQEHPEMREHSKEDLKKAAEAFMANLDSALEANFGTRLQKIFKDVSSQ